MSGTGSSTDGVPLPSRRKARDLGSNHQPVIRSISLLDSSRRAESRSSEASLAVTPSPRRSSTVA